MGELPGIVPQDTPGCLGPPGTGPSRVVAESPIPTRAVNQIGISCDHRAGGPWRHSYDANPDNGLLVTGGFGLRLYALIYQKTAAQEKARLIREFVPLLQGVRGTLARQLCQT
jgi:hypothetical protein